jgi:hypothetical protein
MKKQSQSTTVTLNGDPAKAVRIMSGVFGQSPDQFVEMILKKFFFDQVENDRVQRVVTIAELLIETKYQNRSEAEEASHRLEYFTNLYGPKNSKDLRIRTDVVQYEADDDWGVVCDYQLHNGSWQQVGFNHRPLIGEPVPA